MTPILCNPGDTDSAKSYSDDFLRITIGLSLERRVFSSSSETIAYFCTVSMSGLMTAKAWFFLPNLSLKSLTVSSSITFATRWVPPIPLIANIFPSSRSFAVSLKGSSDSVLIGVLLMMVFSSSPLSLIISSSIWFLNNCNEGPQTSQQLASAW